MPFGWLSSNRRMGSIHWSYVGIATQFGTLEEVAGSTFLTGASDEAAFYSVLVALTTALTIGGGFWRIWAE